MVSKRKSDAKTDHANTSERYSNIDGGEPLWLSPPFQTGLCSPRRWDRSSHREDRQKRSQPLYHCQGLHWQDHRCNHKSCKHIYPSFIPPSLIGSNRFVALTLTLAPYTPILKQTQTSEFIIRNSDPQSVFPPNENRFKRKESQSRIP